jgi:hypothetical protein
MAETKIKRKSWLWHLVPLSGRNRFSSTIGATIYLTPKRYDDYHSDSPSVNTLALVAHEQVHVRQYLEDSRFQWKYVFSRQARLNYEIEAYAEQIKFLLQRHPNRKEEYIEEKARRLSSMTYLLFMGYETVYQKLKAKVEESA